MNEPEKAYKILVVDDIPDNIKLIRNVLYGRDFNISVATDGKQALNIAAIRDFDLFILDIAMPDMDGYEVASKLRLDTRTADVPIIFVTAKTFPTDLAKGFEVGGSDYITKPFNTTELLARVMNHLELKRSKDIIKFQNNDLKELLHTQKKLLSIVSNDLQDPYVKALRNANKLLTRFTSISNEEKIELINEIQQANQIGYDLTLELNEWSQIFSDKLTFKPVNLALNKVIAFSIDQIKEFKKAQKIQIIYEKKNDLSLLADEHMLKRIFFHLLHNAIKFTKPGGDVIISCILTENDAEITVYDTGKGIERDIAESLFQADFFHNSQGTEGETGLGLGLKIVKRYVQKHGGRIWVESMPGIGSDFKFTIPLVRV